MHRQVQGPGLYVCLNEEDCWEIASPASSRTCTNSVTARCHRGILSRARYCDSRANSCVSPSLFIMNFCFQPPQWPVNQCLCLPKAHIFALILMYALKNFWTYRKDLHANTKYKSPLILNATNFFQPEDKRNDHTLQLSTSLISGRFNIVLSLVS